MIKVVNAIIINKKNNRFLVIKRRKGKNQLHPGKWAFPGGIVEEGESEEQALKREVREETGLQIKKIIKKICDYKYKRPDNKDTKGTSFKVIISSNKIIPNKEIDDFKWVTIERFETLDHIKGLDEEAIKVLFEKE